MPTKDKKGEKDAEKAREQRRVYDPEHDVDYGGDMQHDDPDAVPQDGGRKGGHPHSIEEEDERDRRR